MRREVGVGVEVERVWKRIEMGWARGDCTRLGKARGEVKGKRSPFRSIEVGIWPLELFSWEMSAFGWKSHMRGHTGTIFYTTGKKARY